MNAPKSGDLVAIHLKAEFYNQQEATGAFDPKLYQVLEIDERAAVLLETGKGDIGKAIDDYSRAPGRDRRAVMPVIILRTVYEIVPLSQKIIGTCYKEAVIKRHGDA